MAIRLGCLYDGTEFHGFQQQLGLVTVQGVLQQVMEGLLGAGQVVGGGRTDRGVHAQGQVVVWRGPSAVPLERLPLVLNGRLPASIRVSGAESVSDAWDPIRAARGKRYSYRIWRVTESRLPWTRYCYASTAPWSWDRLQATAQLFMGEHDFRAFRGEGSSARTTIRTVTRSAWLREETGDIWRYEVEADGFLYHMVRMMVGAMIQDATDPKRETVAVGLADPEGRKAAGPVPALGLMLDQIIYDR